MNLSVIVGCLKREIGTNLANTYITEDTGLKVVLNLSSFDKRQEYYAFEVAEFIQYLLDCFSENGSFPFPRKKIMISQNTHRLS